MVVQGWKESARAGAMKSFKKLRDFARQGGKNREKQANDGHGSSSPRHPVGSEGASLESTQDTELITRGIKVGRDPLHSFNQFAILLLLCAVHFIFLVTDFTKEKIRVLGMTFCMCSKLSSA